MNKIEVYNFLKDNNIKYEVDEHKAVYNMEELKDIFLKYPTQEAKNLFVRDDKKENYYLISIKGDKRLDLKEFRKQNSTRPLSFANEDELFSFLSLTKGSVTPLGLLNDSNNRVKFYLDSYFLEGINIIGCHPNDNTATIWLNTKDLIKIIENNGNSIEIFNPIEIKK